MALLRESIALIVFVATIATIIARPSRVPEWLAAIAGVAVMVGTGVLSSAGAWQAVAARWDVLLFFAGLMTVVAVAESAGFFSWIAFLGARAAGGSARRLFVTVLVSSAIVTALLTNDAAVLVITPLVFSLAGSLRLRPLPYALASAFMANAGSLALPISNPVNVMIAESVRLTLSEYLALLWLPSVLAIAATAGILWIMLGSKIQLRFEPSRLSAPEGDPRHRMEATVLLALTGAVLVATSALGSFVGVAACGAAALMLAHAALRGRLDWRRVIGNANPTIIVLVAALFALTEGIVKSGVLAAPLTALLHLSFGHPESAGAATALATAVASNVLNNLPTAAVAVAALHNVPFSASVAHRIAGGAIVGCDLGPNLTTIGSLSTLMWLVLLRRRGLEVSALDYLRVGAFVAPVTIVLAVGATLLTMR